MTMEKQEGQFHREGGGGEFCVKSVHATGNNLMKKIYRPYTEFKDIEQWKIHNSGKNRDDSVILTHIKIIHSTLDFILLKILAKF